MQSKHDVIVIGAGGAIGSSACLHLATRGMKVLGLDQFDIGGHERGSSHGQSRMIRMCYFEHSDYVPLLKRAYALWRELERRAGLDDGTLLDITGGVYMGREDSAAVQGSRGAAELHGLEHEMLTRAQLATRHPQFRVDDDFVAMVEPMAGYLRPRRVVATQTRLAIVQGAEMQGNGRVLGWSSDGEHVCVMTDGGEVRGKLLVIAAGAWATGVVKDLGVKVVPTRQVLGWVKPVRNANSFVRGVMPVWAIDAAHLNEGLYYGFPMMADELSERTGTRGFKIARHARGLATDPDRNVWNAIEGDEETYRPCLRRWIPDADGETEAMQVCMYENSPDGHFIIDRHPRFANVVVACGFSGHGFKFASVVGEVVADLVREGKSRHAVGFLGLQRFA